jgi:hypothetical protein
MRDEQIPDEEWRWFIDVLRESVRGGGFQGRSDPENNYRRAPPTNEIARALAAALLPI